MARVLRPGDWPWWYPPPGVLPGLGGCYRTSGPMRGKGGWTRRQSIAPFRWLSAGRHRNCVVPVRHRYWRRSDRPTGAYDRRRRAGHGVLDAAVIHLMKRRPASWILVNIHEIRCPAHWLVAGERQGCCPRSIYSSRRNGSLPAMRQIDYSTHDGFSQSFCRKTHNLGAAGPIRRRSCFRGSSCAGPFSIRPVRGTKTCTVQERWPESDLTNQTGSTAKRGSPVDVTFALVVPGWSRPYRGWWSAGWSRRRAVRNGPTGAGPPWPKDFRLLRLSSSSSPIVRAIRSPNGGRTRCARPAHAQAADKRSSEAMRKVDGPASVEYP